MPHPRPLPSPPRAALGVRLLTVAAIVLGLLGMHVLMSPGAHADHGATAMVAGSPSHHATGMVASADSAAAAVAPPSCDAGCAHSVPSTVQDAWTVVCVLALLLTALIALPRGVSWRTTWRDLPLWTPASMDEADRAPRHPPSLTLLSISRT